MHTHTCIVHVFVFNSYYSASGRRFNCNNQHTAHNTCCNAVSGLRYACTSTWHTAALCVSEQVSEYGAQCTLYNGLWPRVFATKEKFSLEIFKEHIEYMVVAGGASKSWRSSEVLTDDWSIYLKLRMECKKGQRAIIQTPPYIPDMTMMTTSTVRRSDHLTM